MKEEEEEEEEEEANQLLSIPLTPQDQIKQQLIDKIKSMYLDFQALANKCWTKEARFEQLDASLKQFMQHLNQATRELRSQSRDSTKTARLMEKLQTYANQAQATYSAVRQAWLSKDPSCFDPKPGSIDLTTDARNRLGMLGYARHLTTSNRTTRKEQPQARELSKIFQEAQKQIEQVARLPGNDLDALKKELESFYKAVRCTKFAAKASYACHGLITYRCAEWAQMATALLCKTTDSCKAMIDKHNQPAHKSHQQLSSILTMAQEVAVYWNQPCNTPIIQEAISQVINACPGPLSAHEPKKVIIQAGCFGPIYQYIEETFNTMTDVYQACIAVLEGKSLDDTIQSIQQHSKAAKKHINTLVDEAKKVQKEGAFTEMDPSD